MHKIFFTTISLITLGAVAFSLVMLYWINAVPILRSQFVWQTGAEATYGQTLTKPWKKITMAPLAGFTQGFVEKKTSTCLPANAKVENYTKIDGGLCSYGYWLEDKNSKKIASVTQLKLRVAPINSAEKAVSMLYATRTMSPAINGTVTVLTQPFEDGFMVLALGPNYCSDREDYRQIFFVNQKGDVVQLATVPRKTPLCTP